MVFQQVDLMVKGIEKAQELGAEYADAAQLYIKTTQVALRGSNIDVNRHEDVVSVARVVYRGAWGVASRCTPWRSELIDEAHHVARASSAIAGGFRVSIPPIEPTRGYFRKVHEFPQLEDVIALIQYVSDRIREKLSSRDVITEVVMVFTEVDKVYANSDTTLVHEGRSIIEVLISAVIGNVSAAEYTALSIPFSEIKSRLEPMIDTICERLRAMSTAKLLNPLVRGSKFEVILSPTVAGALIHEVAHYLEADRALIQRRIPSIGVKVGCEELTVIDDPTIEWCAGSYFIDDEGVKARSKVLIENGVLTNLLHTRWSAHVLGTHPTGNARGLFTVPKAMQSNLVVKPGDWRFSEMIEETKRGFYVDGLIRAELRPDDLIVLWPEVGWFIERGEVKSAAKVDHIAIQASKVLHLIEGIGRRLGYRASIEHGLYVSEVVPHLKVRDCYVF
ncbi:MAG: hypothetical protein DRJ40_02275 [Thermoprotei archaeon]|nr:MAG: hypothetical protein DRJ40_02275 [Thermoprotei archaeon]